MAVVLFIHCQFSSSTGLITSALLMVFLFLSLALLPDHPWATMQNSHWAATTPSWWDNWPPTCPLGSSPSKVGGCSSFLNSFWGWMAPVRVMNWFLFGLEIRYPRGSHPNTSRKWENLFALSIRWTNFDKFIAFKRVGQKLLSLLLSNVFIYDLNLPVKIAGNHSFLFGIEMLCLQLNNSYESGYRNIVNSMN